jgi:hypothetical protein
MTFLDQLRLLRRAPVAVFLQFDLIYRDGCGDLYAFVEGIADKEYFQYELRRRVEQDAEIHFYVCDGKDGVLRALNDLERRRPSAERVMFLIDKDFDDYIPIHRQTSVRLFTTPYYSIENHLVGEEALRAVFADFAHIESSDPRFALIIATYRRALRRFAVCLRRFIAWAICARRAGLRPNLNNVNLNAVIKLNQELLPCAAANVGIKLGLACGVAAHLVTTTEVRRQMRELTIDEYKRWLRGKAELWFFLKFVNLTWDSLVREPGVGTRPIQKTVQINEANVFQLLADRVTYPSELLAFLDTVATRITRSPRHL